MQSDNWEHLLRSAVSDAALLARLLELELAPIETGFDLKVPLPYVKRMQKGDPNDPLLKQILPIAAENETAGGFVTDPLDEIHYTGSTRGTIQKYYGRVLIIAAGTCAVNCRYCFRRHFPYNELQSRNSDWENIVRSIESDPTITEVIFSGGDPLVLPDAKLARLTAELESIEHVKTLRFHTRLPVVIPQRICDELLAWVKERRSQLVFVLHVNHANEIDNCLEKAINKLKHEGITLLNQAVLLRGVNDSTDALTDLSTQLFDAGVLPYYLHLLDPVAGAEHFNVNQSRAKALMNEITNRLPGYLVPKLVKEVPGEKAKQLISLD